MKWLVVLLVLLHVMILGSIYHVEGYLYPASSTLDATLTVVWTNPLSESTSVILFNLFPNLLENPNPDVLQIPHHEPGWIEIHSVKSDGIDLKYEVTETFLRVLQKYSKDRAMLRIELKDSVPPGKSVELKINFTLHIPRTPSEDESCWGNACVWRFGWYPLEVHTEDGKYSDSMVFEPHECTVDLKLPESWKLVTHEGWGMGCPLVALKDYSELVLEGKDYRVHVHYRSGNRYRAFVVGGVALKALEEYGEKIGNLDYRDVHLVQSQFSGLFGLTAPGISVLGDNAFSTSDLVLPGFLHPLVEFLIYHEIAHLWFGIGVEPNFNENNFLSESLAQFLSIKHVEEAYTPQMNLYEDTGDLLVNFLANLFNFKSLRENYLYLYRDLHRKGLDAPVKGEHEYTNQFLPLDYAKGYFAFRTLELQFGEDRFMDILSKFWKEYRGKVIEYESFKDFISGGDESILRLIDSLFLSHDGIDLKIDLDGDDLVVKAPEFLEYELGVTHTDSSTEIITARGVFRTKISSVVRLDVDPNWRLPDPDRFNNHYPLLFSVDTEEYSPLESYSLEPAYFSAELSASDVITAGGLGVRKFDEWGVQVYYGAKLRYLDENDIESEGVLGLRAFFSIPQFAAAGSFFASENGVEYADLSLSLSIPERIDVGMDPVLVYPRNSLVLHTIWQGYPVVLLQHSFIDPVKTGIFSRNGILLERDSIIPFSDIVWIPSESLDLHFLGISVFGNYELIPYTGQDLTFEKFFSLSAGLHVPVPMPSLKMMNLLSFRGGLISMRFGIEGGESGGSLRKLLSGEISLTPSIHTFLDIPTRFRFYGKILLDVDSGESMLFFGVDSDLPEIVLSDLLLSNRPFAEIRPPEFRIRLSRP